MSQFLQKPEHCVNPSTFQFWYEYDNDSYIKKIRSKELGLLYRVLATTRITTLPESLLRVLHLTPTLADSMILLWYPPLKWLTINHPKFQPPSSLDYRAHHRPQLFFLNLFRDLQPCFEILFGFYKNRTGISIITTRSVITAWNGIHDHIQLMCESNAWISSSACLQNFYWHLISSWDY